MIYCYIYIIYYITLFYFITIRCISWQISKTNDIFASSNLYRYFQVIHIKIFQGHGKGHKSGHKSGHSKAGGHKGGHGHKSSGGHKSGHKGGHGKSGKKVINITGYRV